MSRLRFIVEKKNGGRMEGRELRVGCVSCERFIIERGFMSGRCISKCLSVLLVILYVTCFMSIETKLDQDQIDKHYRTTSRLPIPGP